MLVGPDVEYLEDLADPDSALGDSDRFQRAVPDVDGAISVTYIDFDAGDWLTELTENDRDRRDAEPLDTAGLTVSEEGDQQRLLLRMTFD